MVARRPIGRELARSDSIDLKSFTETGVGSRVRPSDVVAARPATDAARSLDRMTSRIDHTNHAKW
jgi:hypothetical protein